LGEFVTKTADVRLLLILLVVIVIGLLSWLIIYLWKHKADKDERKAKRHYKKQK